MVLDRLHFFQTNHNQSQFAGHLYKIGQVVGSYPPFIFTSIVAGNKKEKGGRREGNIEDKLFEAIRLIPLIVDISMIGQIAKVRGNNLIIGTRLCIFLNPLL